MDLSRIGLSTGMLIACTIDGYRVDEAMVVIENGQLYLLQNRMSGGAPSSMREIMRTTGRNYSGSWNCGFLNDTNGISITKVLSTVKKKEIKVGDEYFDEFGKVFTFREELKNQVMLFNDQNGLPTKMITYNDLGFILYTKDQFDKIEKPVFYKEDLFSKMKFISNKKKKKNKSLSELGAEVLLDMNTRRSRSRPQATDRIEESTFVLPSSNISGRPNVIESTSPFATYFGTDSRLQTTTTQERPNVVHEVTTEQINTYRESYQEYMRSLREMASSSTWITDEI